MQFHNKDFVHLHTHTEFSSFDGLAGVNGMAMQARKMGFPALAITDHGNVCGLLKHMIACTQTKDKKGKAIPYDPIKPILGCEFYISLNHEDRGAKVEEGQSGIYHITVLAKNWAGYRNLCALSDIAYRDGFYRKPRIDVNLLEKYQEGLIITSGCTGSIVSANLIYSRYDEAKKIASIFKDIWKDDYYIEVMYHGIGVEAKITPKQFKIAKELGLPVIATNDNHYVTKEQARSHEVFLAMSQKKCMKDPKRLKFSYDEFYLKSAQEMAEIWGSVPQVIWNTVDVANKVDDKEIYQNLFGAGMRLPRFSIPDGYKNPHDYLTHLANEGMKDLGWDKSQQHIEALQKELNDVKVAWDNNGFDFATYFLIVWDYINWARNNDILVGAGRGSGYASVLLRCLKICHGPDPIENGLLWERFLGFDDKFFIKESDFGYIDSHMVGEVELDDDEEDEISEG